MQVAFGGEVLPLAHRLTIAPMVAATWDFSSQASVARMSAATSGVCLSKCNPACRCAHVGYLLYQQHRPNRDILAGPRARLTCRETERGQCLPPLTRADLRTSHCGPVRGPQALHRWVTLVALHRTSNHLFQSARRMLLWWAGVLARAFCRQHSLQWLTTPARPLRRSIHRMSRGELVAGPRLPVGRASSSIAWVWVISSSNLSRSQGSRRLNRDNAQSEIERLCPELDLSLRYA